MNSETRLQIETNDAHRFELVAVLPEQPNATLLWLPALGVAARHYLPFAEAMAAHGIAVFLHEWRGNGSSSLRADRTHDWGYRELLQHDLPAAEAAARNTLPNLPFRLGGHSLGGQLGSCHAGQSAAAIDALYLVASGTPWWRSFPKPRRYLLPLAYRFLPWLAQRKGALPGRRVGFGGNEARGLINDWARVGLSNHYAAAGMQDVDLDAGMHHSRTPVTAIVFDADWLAPASSTRALLAKMPAAKNTVKLMSARTLNTRADHFHWMKSPQAVANALTFHND